MECDHKEVWSVGIPAGHHVVLCLDCRSVVHWCNPQDTFNTISAAEKEAKQQQAKRLFAEEEYYRRTGKMLDYTDFFEEREA